jgi:hypothetical protein
MMTIGQNRYARLGPQRVETISTTNFLLVLIAAMLGIHRFPSVAYPVIVIVIVLLGWALNEFPKWRKRRSKEGLSSVNSRRMSPYATSSGQSIRQFATSMIPTTNGTREHHCPLNTARRWLT